MRAALPLVTVLASASLAAADPASPADNEVRARAGSEDQITVAFGANFPLLWSESNLGASGYIGFAKQHAIRINAAKYRYRASTAELVSTITGGDGGIYTGGFSDLGIGYQYFSRSMLAGWTLEAGVFRRALDTRVEDDFATTAIVETKATGYAARGLVGYTWLWARCLFLSTNVGVSVGRYAGTERTARSTYMPEYMTEDFVRWKPAAEAYLRFGIAFGL